MSLAAEKFDEQMESLLEGVRSGRRGETKENFGRHARRHLRAVVKKFLKASDADLSDDEALHRLRICTKKLRYTMEMVAVAFKPAFRKKLYPRISRLQDVMGIVNDHAMGKAFFHDWSLRAQDRPKRRFSRGWSSPRRRAHRDVRQAFLIMWTPKSVAEIRRQFNDCDYQA